jgi:hypothetical protein
VTAIVPNDQKGQHDSSLDSFGPWPPSARGRSLRPGVCSLITRLSLMHGTRPRSLPATFPLFDLIPALSVVFGELLGFLRSPAAFASGVQMRGGVTRRLSDCRWRECARDLRRKPCAPRSMSHWSWLGPLDRRRKRQAPGSEQTSRYSAHPIPRDVQPTPTRKPSASDFLTNSCPLLLHSVLLFQGWVGGAAV